MPDSVTLALIALLLPLLAAVVTVVLGAVAPHRAHLPAVFSFAISAALAIMVLIDVSTSSDATIGLASRPSLWFGAGKLVVNFSFVVEPLSAMMLATVTFVATWIAIFSAGYMHGDKGYPRYFAIMCLFVFSMCGLVLAKDIVVMLGFWEGVGLCSYLLVGYYYAKPSAAMAARKAFLVTRLGDIGMLFGIFLLWQMGGYTTDFNTLFANLSKTPPSSAMLNLACLLILCGAVGKSAQFPLYVWLPDAMEGPTPVSALIHAATMVTAGVYLLARTAPLFVMCPDVQIIVSLIGGFTALLAAFIALAQTDLKRVLAYSTVSQLGYMFMALGCSGVISPTVAVGAALFHLFTHAFFKALLFLGSGSVMHAMGNIIDMRKFGGLRQLMPTTHWTFLCGAAALAGLPILSGFWSKDGILHALSESAQEGHYANWYEVVFIVGLLTAFLTAFYTFRAYFLTFWGDERIPAEAGHHAHESPRNMTLPLVVLAIGALAIGFVADPLTHWFPNLMHASPILHQADSIAGKSGAHSFSWSLAGLSSVIAIAGVGLAWSLYRNGGAERAPFGLGWIWQLSKNKLYVDEIYRGVVVIPAEISATASRQIDGLLDSLTRLISFIPRFTAAALRPLQNGLFQFYALGMVLGLAVFLTVIVFRTVR